MNYIVGMTHLEKYSESRDNNFNLIRFLAAFAVVVSHSTSIINGEDVVELLQLETGYSLGNLAVNVFFVVSGFLIAQSFVRSRDIFEYMTARVLRLLPGLIVAAFLTAFIIGPLVTSASMAEYYGDIATWTYVPFIGSLMMETSIELKGVFDTLPFAHELNTPLWTLRWEFLAYIGIGFLGVLGILSSKIRFGIVFLLFVSLFIGVTQFSDLRISISAIDHAFRLGFCFLLGAAFYMYRSSIPIGIIPAIALWGLTYLVKDTVLYQLNLILAMGYSTFWLAYIPSGIIRQYNKLGDVSYGVYIYGFLLSQVIILVMPGLGTVTLVLVSIPFIIGAAALSYYLVEAPAMKQRKKVAAAIRSTFGKPAINAVEHVHRA